MEGVRGFGWERVLKGNLEKPKNLEEVRGDMRQAVEGLPRSEMFWGKGLGKRPQKADLKREYPHSQHFQKSIPCSAELVPLLWPGCPEEKWGGTLHAGFTRGEHLCPTLLLRTEVEWVGEGSLIQRKKSHQAR